MSRAARDAGKQVRTAVKREIGKELNLYSAEIASRLSVTANQETVEFRVRYKRIPAHHYKGARYRRAYGEKGVRTEYVGRRTSLTRRRKDFAETAGLTVKFTRGKAAERFPKAFRQQSLGEGRVFFQRKSEDWMPIISIVGPTPHGIAEESFKNYAELGKEAYIQRLNYWGRKAIEKAQS